MELNANDFNEYIRENGLLEFHLKAIPGENFPQVHLIVNGTGRLLSYMLASAIVDHPDLYLVLKSAVTTFESSVSRGDVLPNHRAAILAIRQELDQYVEQQLLLLKKDFEAVPATAVISYKLSAS